MLRMFVKIHFGCSLSKEKDVTLYFHDKGFKCGTPGFLFPAWSDPKGKYLPWCRAGKAHVHVRSFGPGVSLLPREITTTKANLWFSIQIRLFNANLFLQKHPRSLGFIPYCKTNNFANLRCLGQLPVVSWGCPCVFLLQQDTCWHWVFIRSVGTWAAGDLTGAWNVADLSFC